MSEETPEKAREGAENLSKKFWHGISKGGRTYTGKEIVQKVAMTGYDSDKAATRLQNMAKWKLIRPVEEPGTGRTRIYSERETVLALIGFRMNRAKIEDFDIGRVLEKIREHWRRSEHVEEDREGWGEATAKLLDDEHRRALAWRGMLLSATRSPKIMNLLVGFSGNEFSSPTVDIVEGPVSVDERNEFSLVIRLTSLCVLADDKPTD